MYIPYCFGTEMLFMKLWMWWQCSQQTSGWHIVVIIWNYFSSSKILININLWRIRLVYRFAISSNHILENMNVCIPPLWRDHFIDVGHKPRNFVSALLIHRTNKISIMNVAVVGSVTSSPRSLHLLPKNIKSFFVKRQ